MENFDIVSWAGIMGTAIAGAGLCATAYQLYVANRAHDVDWLFRYHGEVREMERRLLATRHDPEAHRIALVELMNLLCICAKACQEKLFPRRTRQFAVEYLIKAIANIQSIEELNAVIDEMLTSSTTFNELANFASKHREEIKCAAAEVAALDARLIEDK